MTTVVAAVISRGQRILVCQRGADGAHPLKWEFPGGKVEAAESLATALRRELREELGITALNEREISRYEYTYFGNPPILLVFFSVTGYTGETVNHVFERIEWSTLEELPRYDFLEGDREFVTSTAFQEKTALPGRDSTAW